MKEETPIDHAINTLVDFNWLATCQERDYNDIKTESRRSKNTGEDSVAKTTVDLSSTRKQLILPLSYDEFKVTRCFMIDNEIHL